MNSIKNECGFSLLELLAAVVIVGILAAVAIPSYMSSVTKGSRASVQTELLQLAALQEKIYLNSNSYSTAAITDSYNGQSSGGLGWTATSRDDKYTFSCSACTANTYTLTATPVAGKSQAADGSLSIDQTGNKLWTGGSAANW